MVSIRMLVVFCLFALSAHAGAQEALPLVRGQTLYLPVYSHIWYGDVDGKGKPEKTLVSVLVSIRNTDPSRSIRLLSARYYDTEGRQLREYIQSPRTVAAMGTLELFVPRSDDTGGSGANFVIAWQSDLAVNPPIVEALHVNLPSGSGRSVAFTTAARPISAD